MPPVKKPKASRKATKKASSNRAGKKIAAQIATESLSTMDQNPFSGQVSANTSSDTPNEPSSTIISPEEDHTSASALLPPPIVTPPTPQPPKIFADGYIPPVPAADLFAAFARRSTQLDSRPYKHYICSKWTRIIHSAPKCDVCHQKAHEVGTLQLCGCGKVTICKACVQGGYLERRNQAGGSVLHRMDVREMDWSVVEEEERKRYLAEHGKRRKRGGKKRQVANLEVEDSVEDDGDEVGEVDVASVSSLQQHVTNGRAHTQTSDVLAPMLSHPSQIRHKLPDVRPVKSQTNVTLPPLRQLQLPREHAPTQTNSHNEVSDGGPRHTPHSREVSQPTYDKDQLDATEALLSMSRYVPPSEAPLSLHGRPLPEGQISLPPIHHDEAPLPQPLAPQTHVFNHDISHHLTSLAHTLYNDVLFTHHSFPHWPIATALLFEAARSWTRGELSEVHRGEGVSPVEAWDDMCRVVMEVEAWLGIQGDWGVWEWLERERRGAEERMRQWEQGDLR